MKVTEDFLTVLFMFVMRRYLLLPIIISVIDCRRHSPVWRTAVFVGAIDFFAQTNPTQVFYILEKKLRAWSFHVSRKMKNIKLNFGNM